MFLNQIASVEDIKHQDISNIPYFAIPMYEVDINVPPQIPGKCYQDEYFKGLDEQCKLNDIIQELLLEKEEFTNKIKDSQRTTRKRRRKSKKKYNRVRRKAKEITRLFVCDSCGKAYGSEGSLKHHIKNKHLK